MIVRWPGHVQAGSVSEAVWAFWDVLPTFAELAGVQAPSGIDGVSQVPAIFGKGEPGQREFLYWEFHEGGFKQAVRTGRWKAVRLGPGKALELYDLENDVGEARNVAAEHPVVVARIEAYLNSVRTDSPDFPIRSAGP
jgi:arylsulfatase A-like enzyme